MPRKVPEIRIKYIERGPPCELCELEHIDDTLPSGRIKHMTEHETLRFLERRRRARELRKAAK